MLDFRSTAHDRAGRNARHHYAVRWVEFYPDSTQMPVNFPLSRRQVQDLLFAAGTAEAEDSTDA